MELIFLAFLSFEALERYSYIYEKLKADGIFTIFFYFFVLVIFWKIARRTLKTSKGPTYKPIDQKWIQEIAKISELPSEQTPKNNQTISTNSSWDAIITKTSILKDSLLAFQILTIDLHKKIWNLLN